MLSLAFVSLKIAHVQRPTPPIQLSQFPKLKRNSKKRNSDHKNAIPFHCSSFKNSIQTSNFDNSINVLSSQEHPDASVSDPKSVTQCIDPDTLGLWLQSCYGAPDVRRIHAIVLKCLRSSVTYVGNNLVSAYLRFGKLDEARKVFDNITKRDVVSWTAIINGYLSCGLDDEALRLLDYSIKNGVQPNGKTFVCVLNLCSRRLDFDLGMQTHACILKTNYKNLIVDSAIVYFYAQFGELSSAFRAFNQMPKRDVVCWTTLITACSQLGQGKEAFLLFMRMLSEGFSPNEVTICSVLKACGEEKALKFGRQLHSAIVKKMYKEDVFIGSSLVDMYAKCGEVIDSRKVFSRMRTRNSVTWTSMIAGYARKELGKEAITLFRMMKRRRIAFNNLTFVSILRACGSIGALLTGREIHAQVVKNSIQSNLYIGSTLMWFYCKCGEPLVASKVLQQMPLRDVVSWTAIISGYAATGHEFEALEFLKEMMEEGVGPNSFTCSSALKVCANLEATAQGKSIHSFANKTSSLSNVFVGSALIHMYAKCGYLSEAIQVLDGMPDRNLVSWTAIIMGYVRNGLCREAFKLMYRMKAEGFEVEDATFALVLNECASAWDEKSSSEYCL